MNIMDDTLCFTDIDNFSSATRLLCVDPDVTLIEGVTVTSNQGQVRSINPRKTDDIHLRSYSNARASQKSSLDFPAPSFHPSIPGEVHHHSGDDVIEINDSSDEEEKCPAQTNGKEDKSTSIKPVSTITTEAPPSSCLVEVFVKEIKSDLIQTFESAMDDWYSKLSAHRPLEDCEILESAQQLARHFKVELPHLSTWLARFKERHTQNESSNAAPKLPQVPSSRDRLTVVGQRDSTGKKLYVEERRQDDNPDFPLMLMRASKTERSEWCGGELIVSHTKRHPNFASVVIVPRKKDKAQIDVKNVIEGTAHAEKRNKTKGSSIENNAEQSSTAKKRMKFYPPAGKTLTDEMMITAKEDLLSTLESQLLEWYLSKTTSDRRMVTASAFEARAMFIASSLNIRTFTPTKTWIRIFMGRHGMWCTFSKKLALFLEPATGLLKARFAVEFEAWYHLYPISPDYLLRSESTFIPVRPLVDKYLSAIFDWYLSMSSSVQAEDMLKAEEEVAEAAGLTIYFPREIETFYYNWCLRHKQFYQYIETGCIRSVPFILPSVLKSSALRSAEFASLPNFICPNIWMKRFLQLNGLVYQVGDTSHRYMLHFCCREKFEVIFSLWLRSGVSPSKFLHESLDRFVPKEVIPRNSFTPVGEGEKDPAEKHPPLKIECCFSL